MANIKTAIPLHTVLETMYPINIGEFYKAVKIITLDTQMAAALFKIVSRIVHLSLWSSWLNGWV